MFGHVATRACDVAAPARRRPQRPPENRHQCTRSGRHDSRPSATASSRSPRRCSCSRSVSIPLTARSSATNSYGSGRGTSPTSRASSRSGSSGSTTTTTCGHRATRPAFHVHQPAPAPRRRVHPVSDEARGRLPAARRGGAGDRGRNVSVRGIRGTATLSAGASATIERSGTAIEAVRRRRRGGKRGCADRSPRGTVR